MKETADNADAADTMGVLPAKFRRLAHHSFPLQLHILKVQEDRQL